MKKLRVWIFFLHIPKRLIGGTECTGTSHCDPAASLSLQSLHFANSHTSRRSCSNGAFVQFLTADDVSSARHSVTDSPLLPPGRRLLCVCLFSNCLIQTAIVVSACRAAANLPWKLGHCWVSLNSLQAEVRLCLRVRAHLHRCVHVHLLL